MPLDRGRLRDLLARERVQFRRPRTLARASSSQRARASLLAGVPMNWMVRSAGDFPIFVESASGAHFTDVDGHRYLDLCLGDTGAMTGHAPSPAAAAVAEQARRGFTFMLPTEDAVWRRRGARPPLRAPVLADGADGHRRQPLRDPPRAARHGAPPDPRLQLVLPRDGGRDVRDPPGRRRRRAVPETSGPRSIRPSPPASSSSTTFPRSNRRSPMATSRACWPSR